MIPSFPTLNPEWYLVLATRLADPAAALALDVLLHLASVAWEAAKRGRRLGLIQLKLNVCKKRINSCNLA